MVKYTKVVGSKDILSTKDFDMFKQMPGNRKVDAKHVKQLERLMLTNGNLTYEFPIVVNREMFIVDGQHRYEALKELGWEIGYVIEETATIETVRAINQGNRNWSWRDLAESYASLGNDNYRWFINFVDTYNFSFSPSLAIASNTLSGSGNNTPWAKFRRGDFEIKDKQQAHDRARQIRELLDMLDDYHVDAIYALMAVTKSAAYSHDRMKQKLKAHVTKMPLRAKRLEYMRVLEEIYNFGYPEDNKVRLF